MKKDDLTILQEYSKREKQTKKLIETNKSKGQVHDSEGLSEIDYALFKDEVDQLMGIIQGLKLTVRSRRN